MKICPECHAIHPHDSMVCPIDGMPLVDCETWPEGAVIQDKYRILARVGQDMACTVYKALQIKPEKLRALKVMNRDMASNRAFVDLFKQDALHRKKLRHANVAHIVGIDEMDDGRPFIIMEYVEGRNLQEIIRQDAPLAPLRAGAIARQVAAALEAAHALGMVHRDVKPESIFVSQGSDGEKVKLLGFGIAQLKEARLGGRFRTSPEAVIGTFQYLSPEQALGQLRDELDGRTDLYSLGVIMYEMLTGALPFQATTAADWMTAHIQGIPTPIRVAHADLAIPDVLTNLVMQCLKKDRQSRPASAREFIREIERVENELERAEKAEPSSAQPSAPHKSPGWKFWKS
jgi:serine/threonine-protein kinase